MATFMYFWNLKPETAKALVEQPENREAANRGLFEQFGGRLLGYYFTGSGEFDGVILCELPDPATARAVHLLQTASGKFERMEVTQLFTAVEAENIAMTANSRLGAWTSPGRRSAT